MSEDNSVMVSFKDATLCIKWELTKEEYDNCEFPNFIQSPKYLVQIGSDKSEWVIQMYPKGRDENLKGALKNSVWVILKLVSENKKKSYNVCASFGVKTSEGYLPQDFLELTQDREYFEEYSKTRYSGHTLCLVEKFSEEFVENKVILEAFLVFSMTDKNNLNLMEIANDFIDDFKEVSSFDTLSDFTIICHEKRFPCHKVLLAAKSQYFEALFRNENKQEIKIDDSSPEIVAALLDFMSKGFIPTDLDEKAMDLISLADMFGLNLLKKACEESLVQNLSLDNILETFVIVDKHVQRGEIRQKILKFIKKESILIVKAENWKTFAKEYTDLVTEIIIAISSK